MKYFENLSRSVISRSKRLIYFSILLFYFSFSSLAQNSCCNSILVNDGFENTAPGSYTAGAAVTGWSLSSQTFSSCATSSNWVSGSPEFSIVSTPLIDPIIGIIGNSPLGGNVVAKLNNNTAGNLRTRLTQTVNITSNDRVFTFAYAGAWQQSNHNCCERASFSVNLKDCQGNVLSCLSVTLAPATNSCSGVQNYNLNSGVQWTNWRTQSINLGALQFSCVTIEIVNNDCAQGDHFGTVYVDAISCTTFGPSMPNIYFPGIGGYSPGVSFCPSSNIAQMCAPLGFATYSWVAPNINPPMMPGQSTLSCISFQNPIVNSHYTLIATTIGGCQFLSAHYLFTSQVSINSICSRPSCTLGTSGSASVELRGSASGYNYTWLNSSSSVVSTASIATNLSPGVYSVIVSAIGSANCGTAMATTTVGVINNGTQNIIQPYCDTLAYLTINGGTNLQWNYFINSTSLSPISSAPSLTISNPVNGSAYLMTRTSSQGCSDSIIYTLFQSPATSVTILSNKTICVGDTNGEVVLKLNSVTPSLGTNFFIVNSTGTTTPYTSSINPTSSNQFTASNLSANGTYSLSAFDGACKYSTAFTVTPFVFDYTIQPQGSQTLCPGNSIFKFISFSPSVSASAFTYSWSPNVFFYGYLNTYSSTVIIPTVSVGNQTTIVYTVVATPTLVNCPLTKSFSITSINPATPTITNIPDICTSSQQYTVTANPPGGAFSGQGIFGPVITPVLLSIGTNTINYTHFTSNCGATSTSTFLMKQSPNISLTGNQSICKGDNITMSVSGAMTYTWSSGSNASLITFTPINFGIHTLSVSGTGSNNCSSIKIFTISVAETPTLTLLGNTEICEGKSTTITVAGAPQYYWNNGSQSASIVLSPSLTTNYTVQGFSNLNCSTSKTVAIIVKNNPVLGVSNTQTICAGDQVAISAIGADTYLWNTKDTTNYILTSPQASYVYTVVGTIDGCSSTKTVGLVVIKCTDLQTNELKTQDEVIYPNPSKGLFFVKLKSAGAIKVFNGIGQMVFESTSAKEDHTIDLSGFADGVYTLNVIEHKGNRTIRLVKKQ